MLRRFIAFLIKRKLGVKDFENFQFAEQKSEYDHYFFDGGQLYKWTYDKRTGLFELGLSHVSYNWMTDPNCSVKKFPIEKTSLYKFH